MNCFGNNFRVTLFGESHGEQVGVVIDGHPAGLKLDMSDLIRYLERRKSLNNLATTQRKEEDKPIVISGLYNDYTTGAPLCIVFNNMDKKSDDYKSFEDIPRPGHTDFTGMIKYRCFNDLRGGGHFSGRLTVAVVAAAYIARLSIRKKILQNTGNTASEGDIPLPVFHSEVIELGGLKDKDLWEKALSAVASEGDSLGAVVKCTISNIPAGIGSPFFNSLESLISHAVFSIPGVRGIEFGDGFSAASMKGSEHNDAFVFVQPYQKEDQNQNISSVTQNDTKSYTSNMSDNVEETQQKVMREELYGNLFSLRTNKNGCGGINGGISNGNDIVFNVAFKPTSSIKKAQNSANIRIGEMENFSIPGRHDTCFALRCPVIVEAMAALAIADLIMESA